MNDSAEERAQALLGKTLGKGYRLDALIGQGAMGAVFRARGPDGQEVAVKALNPDLMGGESSLRFLRESELVRGLRHRHVVRTLDAGVDEQQGVLYLVMPLLSGRDLDRVLDELGALRPDSAVRIALQAARGLSAAHAIGIVHRDVKPGNLILDQEGDQVVVQVCDFGLAKQLGGGESLTTTGSQLGTPDYVSPEQLKSSKHVDARTDMWSLGATLYQMLCGKTPFAHVESVFDLISAIIGEDVPELQGRAPWIDASLSVVVHRALMRDPQQRFANLEDFAEALRPFAGGSERLEPALIEPVSAEMRRQVAPRAILRTEPAKPSLPSLPSQSMKPAAAVVPAKVSVATPPTQVSTAPRRAIAGPRSKSKPKRPKTSLRALKVLLLLLATMLAVPGSFVIRQVFFPPRLAVTSIKTERVYQDSALLERAYALPVAATYREALLFQPNGSLCGPTSVANVERSWGKPASIATVLDGSGKCWLGICWGGVSLDELAELTRAATGRKVTLLRDLTLETFRAELRRVNEPGRRYIANFQRAPLFSQGGGHHSPLAAYLEPEDLVLVLDVNQDFKPWLVHSERLFRAIDTADGAKKRGLLRVE